MNRKLEDSIIYDCDLRDREVDEIKLIISQGYSKEELGEELSEFYRVLIEGDTAMRIESRCIGRDLIINDGYIKLTTHEYELIDMFKNKIRDAVQLNIPFRVFEVMVKDFIGKTYNTKLNPVT